MSSSNLGCPVVTGISPKDGIPGTQVTIRGENLGVDQSDLLALIICDTDCLVAAKWKSSSKIVTRVGQAPRGLGDITIVTKSGGRGTSNVQFRVFFEQIGPLTPSSVWVDESRTVPVRNTVRTVPEAQTVKDVLGLNVSKAHLDEATLQKMFPDYSGNLRMNNFSPVWYLLENYKTASLPNLVAGISNLKKAIAKGRESSKDVHKSNLHSLIQCVKALDTLHLTVESDRDNHGWPLTTDVAAKISSAKETSNQLFCDVLGRKDRADATRNALSVLTRFRFIFFLIESIDENLSIGDYATILSDYSRARALFKDTETALFKEVMTELNQKIEQFKETLQNRLIGIPGSLEEQNKIIKYLMILDPSSNPAWNCVNTYHTWLEQLLFELQDKYKNSQSDEFRENQDPQFYSNSFVSEVLTTLCEKLISFWKLAAIYSSTDNSSDGKADVDQMIVNTVNLASWLILNALKALPSEVKEQHKNFIDWPVTHETKSDTLGVYLTSLKTVRVSINSLLEGQFNRNHVQPLIELSKTLRIKGIELLTDYVVDDVLGLSVSENWKLDFAANQFKTVLPDLYEAKVNELLIPTKQLLSSNGFPLEEDLFINDKFRQMVVDRYLMVLCSIKDCVEQLTSLKGKRRPHRLAILNESDSGSVNSAVEEKTKTSQELVSRRLLIAVCNIDYIVQHLLSQICKRLSENLLKFSELIFEKAKQEFIALRIDLISRYLELKTGPLNSLLECLSYQHLPEEDDVSAYVKELMMGVLFIKSELILVSPSMTDTIIASAVEMVSNNLLKAVSNVKLSSDEHATQLVIDITALELALQPYLNKRTRRALNEIRAKHKTELDTELFEDSLANFKIGMTAALYCLVDGKVTDQEFAEMSDV